MMLTAHAASLLRAGLSAESLSETFSAAMFGNGIVAIFCGVVAQAATDFWPLFEYSAGSSFHIGGYCTPFDLAILCLSLQAILV